MTTQPTPTPVPMPAFAPVDKPVGGACVEVVVDVVLAIRVEDVGVKYVADEDDKLEDKVDELVGLEASGP